MSKKRYNGYRSFQYFEPGTDYKVFKLSKEVVRVPPYVVPVTPEEERTVQEILIITSWCQSTSTSKSCPKTLPRCGVQPLRPQLDRYEGMSLSGVDVVIDNFMNGSAVITSHSGWKWMDIIHDPASVFPTSPTRT